MARLQPGWFISLCATILSASCWLPWLTATAGSGGRASAIGGTVGSLSLPQYFGAGQVLVLVSSVLIVLGAMVARGLSPRLAATLALVLSACTGGLGWWFCRANTGGSVTLGYGAFIAAGAVAGALGCSIWALVRPPSVG